MIGYQTPTQMYTPTDHDGDPIRDSAVPASAIDPAESTIRAKHDFWIQTVPGLVDGIYLSTFQSRRGQHITSLTPEQARALGIRLMILAAQAEER